MEEERLKPKFNNYILINIVLFVFIFILDFFVPINEFTAIAAGIILSYNGGYFLSAAFTGNFGNGYIKFKNYQRVLLLLSGLLTLLTGVMAFLVIII